MADNYSMVWNDSNSECPSLMWYKSVGATWHIIGYYVTSLLYLVFGMSGHALCLVAFYEQAKQETAYRYQIFVAVSETIEVFLYATFSMTFYWWSGVWNHPGADWFQSCYSCMWYASHISIPFLNVFESSSMLLSVAMAADRIFALEKPFKYKNINHKFHQMVAVVCCMFLSISTSVFDCFRMYPEMKSETGIYMITVNNSFVNSQAATGLAQLRNVMRIIGLVALIGCNIKLTRSYHNRVKQVSQLTTTTTDGKDVKRKQSEKTLILLSIFQSLLNSLYMSCLISYYAVLYIVPTFNGCEGILWTPILDMTLQLIDMADFYIMLSVSKEFRQMIWKTVPCFEWISSKITNVSNATTTENT